MIFINTPDKPIYATVWKVNPSENGKYIDLQVSTSERISDEDYENSHWFPRVIGKAVNTLKGLKVKDRIAITRAKLTNVSKETTEGKRSFFRFLILEAEIAVSKRVTDDTDAADTNKVNKPAEEPVSSAATEDDCPW